MASTALPKFFASPQKFREWLEKNHDKVPELFVGFYKKESGKGGLTYPEAVDEALCIGWIDGVRKRVDDVSYMNRFTPRKAKSYWSAVNTKRFRELEAEGRVHPAGRAAFGKRDAEKTKKYSFEREESQLAPEFEKLFRKNREAWKHFEASAPGYRKLAKFYVMGAKQDATRQKRLEQIIGVCSRNELSQFITGKKKEK